MQSNRDPIEVPFTAPIPRRITIPMPDVPDTDEPLVPNAPFPDEEPEPSFAPIPESPPERERKKERELVPA